MLSPNIHYKFYLTQLKWINIDLVLNSRTVTKFYEILQYEFPVLNNIKIEIHFPWTSVNQWQPFREYRATHPTNDSKARGNTETTEGGFSRNQRSFWILHKQFILPCSLGNSVDSQNIPRENQNSNHGMFVENFWTKCITAPILLGWISVSVIAIIVSENAFDVREI